MGNPLFWLLGKMQGMSDEDISNSEQMLNFGAAEQKGGADMGQIAQDAAEGDAGQALVASLHKKVGEGTGLNSTDANADRAAANPLGATLAGQAKTGGGAWEDALKRGTLNATNSAMALGQSTPGVGYQTELRNIGNAQAAAKQRAVGQGNILRAQSQQEGQGLYGQFLQGQGAQDITQAGAESDVAQQQRATDAAQRQQAQGNASGLISGGAQAVGAMLSDGGTVPGEPKVFGDSEKNDTVPAWLSPGEIVIPRHITEAPDAPERAAAFVAAVRAKHHPSKHFDDGGTVPVPSDVMHTPVGNFANPFATDIQAPSVGNGAILQTGNYDANRTAVLGNQQAMLASAQGKGPSVAPQQMQDATDANIAAAMAAGAKPMTSGAIVSGATAANQGAAGQGAETAAKEQTGAERELGQSLLAQRQQDMALAQRKQAAMMRNAQLNMGLDLAHQAMLRNVFSGAGQGLEAGVRGMGESSDQPERGSASDLSGGHTDTDFAHGGEVPKHEKRRASAFLKALGRAA